MILKAKGLRTTSKVETETVLNYDVLYISASILDFFRDNIISYGSVIKRYRKSGYFTINAFQIIMGFSPFCEKKYGQIWAESLIFFIILLTGKLCILEEFP
jgi:hypothetical protein